jgi:DNA-binding CsgD family transcriptional regulator
LAALPVANLWLAGGCALLQDHERMELAIVASLAPDPDDPRILGDLWGRVRATDAIVRDDRDDLRAALDTMMTYVRVAPITTSVFPTRVLWAVLHTVEDDDLGAAAGAELRSAHHLFTWPVFTRSLALLDAVALGRAGRAEEAAAAAAPSLAAIPFGLGEGSMRYLSLVVAEAQVRDGWGEPVPLIRAVEAFFAVRGYDAIVKRCHALLGAAGEPVPRKGRGDAVVPERLRALGITSREMDVLQLVGEGLSNREVAERLFVSPKTVERHMSSLFARTGRRSRRELAQLLRELPG